MFFKRNSINNLWDQGFVEEFLHMTPKACSIKEKKVNQLDLIKMKNFDLPRRMINYRLGENKISHKEFKSKIYLKILTT